jgi:hypothetical protein
LQGGKRRSVHLEEALPLAPDPRQRAEIALEVAEPYAALFRSVDAADAVERGLTKLGDTAGRCWSIGKRICGLHNASRFPRQAGT